jgi:hypothetical protein
MESYLALLNLELNAPQPNAYVFLLQFYFASQHSDIVHASSNINAFLLLYVAFLQQKLASCINCFERFKPSRWRFCGFICASDAVKS